MSSFLSFLADLVAVAAPIAAIALLVAVVVLANPEPAAARDAAPRPIARFWAWMWARLRAVLGNLRHVVLLRYPLLLGLFLIGMPAIALHTPLRDKIGNLLVVTPVELAFVTFLAVVVAWIIVRTAALTLNYGPARFDVPPWPVLPPTPAGGRLAAVIAWLGRNGVAAVATPLILVTAVRSLADAPFGVPVWPIVGAGTAARAAVLAGAVIVGAIGAYVVRAIVEFLRIDPSPTDRTMQRRAAKEAGEIRSRVTGLVERAARWMYRVWFRWLGDGYAENGAVASGHLAAVVQFGLCLILYVIIGAAFSPANLIDARGVGWALNGCWNTVPWLCMPTLGYLCIVTGVAAWTFSATSFLFDRWRVPPLLVLFVLFGLSATLMPADHYYRMTRSTLPGVAARAPGTPSDGAGSDVVPSPAFPSPAEIVGRTLAAQDGPGPKRLIVVAVSGGGITSAAWTARVLTGLESAVGEPFTGALSAVSTVSGGSVGAMYYLGAMNDRRPRPAPVLEGIRDASAAPGMRAIAWGIAYPDIWRAVAPYLVGLVPNGRYFDRAWSAETAWERAWTLNIRAAAGQLGNPPDVGADGAAGYGRQGEAQETWTASPDVPYLLDLRQRIAETDLPVPIFNTMTVEDGQQFILSPVDLLPSGTSPRRCGERAIEAPVADVAQRSPAGTSAGARAADPPEPLRDRHFCTYRETYPDADLPLVTAARLSASFPWVSPVARPSAKDCQDCGPLYHLSDGGYFDNDGLIGAMAWLEQVLPTFAEQSRTAGAAGGSGASGASLPSTREILIIQIRWGKWTPATLDELKPAKGALFQMIGPFQALLRARGATQSSHNAQTLRLMNERWSREVLERYQVGVKMVDFDLAGPPPPGGSAAEPPLAWQLTDREVAQINAQWCGPAVIEGVNEVARYLGTTAAMGCPGGQ